MNPHDHDPQQEQQLLQHFRQHSRGEPSAALDALILDAAREAVAQPAPQPNRAQRLHAWLFGVGSRTRWSAAFASLAIVGVGLSLTWRTQEQLPATYDLPAPMAAQAPAAPVLREMAPARKQFAEPEQKKAEMAGSMADAVEPKASYAAPAPAASMARQMPMAKPAAPQAEALSDAADDSRYSNEQAEAVPALERRLRDVLRLREEGRQAQADQLLSALKQEYPRQDLDIELKRLQAEMEKPGRP